MLGKISRISLAVMIALAVSGQRAHALDAERKMANEAQVIRDIEAAHKWLDAPLACYVVPPISSVKRLPGTLPPDGRLDDTITVIAAKDSYEPASFVIYPFSDLDGVELHVSDLQSQANSLPAENVDIKLVKSWFRGGTAWHSYFTDPDRRTLVPELLLNDQDLIQVDIEREENYLRIDYLDGPQYRWVSYPREARGNLDVFNHAKEPVRDAERLLPFRLKQGLTQQIWMTVDVPEDAKAGLYTGEITLSANDGFSAKMTLRVRVLPFSLPEPKTYYSLDEDFHTIIYNSSHFLFYRELLGTDLEAIEKQILAELKNLRKHNVKMPLVRLFDNPEDGRRQLALMRKAEMDLDILFAGSSVINWQDIFQYGNSGNRIPPARLETLAERVESERQLLEEELGHSNLYAIGWDEPGRPTLRSQQPLIALLHEKGLKYYTTAKNWHFEIMGYNQDAVNISGKVNRETARLWHTLGTKVFAYSYPHTGPENPDFIRRTHGMRLYKKDYDGTANYRYQGYRQNNWNDFTNPSFRIRFTYPTQYGVIDTLHWAGFREAIDDIRYATKLRQVARQAIEAGDAESRYVGKKALRYLELLDERTDDLTAARLEMINFILEILKRGANK